ncbi:hypothetical protein JCM4914_09480 [Streptomyces platensis subsp. malvinus]
MLPKMADHGCSPEYHTTNIKTDDTHVERCTSCGYTITHERQGGDGNVGRNIPAPYSDRNSR